MSSARTIATVSALLLFVLAPGCKKKGDEGPAVDPTNPITPSEAEMGRKACGAYVESVCDCAVAVPALAEQCDLARAQPDALDLNLRAALAEGNQTNQDRAALLSNTRKIVRVCIEQQAALATKGCPPETLHTGDEAGDEPGDDGVKPPEPTPGK